MAQGDYDDFAYRVAPDCDDQLPMIANAGRGLKGDSYRIRIPDPDTENETHLEGMWYDHGDGMWHSDWISENINGGQLLYQYNLRPFTIPRTFTITFMYRRPGRKEWSWTTPAIPYIWTLDPAGKPDTDPDHVVGSGVATVFAKTGIEDRYPWIEKLIYPDGTVREDFNAPEQGEGWTSNLLFGVGGDIECPNVEDLSNILGWPEDKIEDAANKIDHPISGQPNIKDYIDAAINQVNNYINNQITNIWNQMNIIGPDGDIINVLNELRRPPISIKIEGDMWNTGSSSLDQEGWHFGMACRYEYHRTSWLVVVKVAGDCFYTGSRMELFDLPDNLRPIMDVNVPAGPNCQLTISQNGAVSIHTYDGLPFDGGPDHGHARRVNAWGTACFYAGTYALANPGDSENQTENERELMLLRVRMNSMWTWCTQRGLHMTDKTVFAHGEHIYRLLDNHKPDVDEVSRQINLFEDYITKTHGYDPSDMDLIKPLSMAAKAFGEEE